MSVFQKAVQQLVSVFPPPEPRQRPKPKQRRKHRLPPDQAQLACWLRKRTSNLAFGNKRGRDLRHVNTKAEIAAFWKSRVDFLASWANRHFADHLSRKITLYFVASDRTPTTLLMIDVDCKKSGSLEGALNFCCYLRDNHFPGLYFEPSTNGNGAHGYIEIVTEGIAAAEISRVYTQFQTWLRMIHATTDFDCEFVEVKGHPLQIKQVNGEPIINMGQLAKLPLDPAVMDTTKINGHDKDKSNRPFKAGSTAGGRLPRRRGQENNCPRLDLPKVHSRGGRVF